MAQEAINFVHEDENWRQRVRYETESQKVFKDNWGFLETTRAEGLKFDTRLVKYFNPAGGTWTVNEKRIPERRKRGDKSDAQPSFKTAAGATALTHTAKMSHIADINVSFNTTTSTYGSRSSLEQFGISQYGRKATRTQQPSN
mmetsp:Transcript_12282/g.40322  ORF Transcript_12282/g.40322 Transcript_12282/m.40322 type:complete len:143 (-) Transcript_12282:52-480(-)|eukprot:CAMPEP_0170144170 /NCGR_PEP_ID=MMETSP0033_2-20121228/13338_1 /TAXON_ID=195969 /ORGANISM="Dolichomastix tenuilepis, Strain CCMP3274" /LENGTH=142 /DNA_ID=CAMNT_0010380655 /DNA_START=59 /DNA_END=487 /DNA_ORIENTATION=+